jgi:hypothetical protein
LQLPVMIICVQPSLNPRYVHEDNYGIKPHLLTLVQQNQFGGSDVQGASMHLKNITEICDKLRIKDVNSNTIKLPFFSFFT